MCNYCPVVTEATVVGTTHKSNFRDYLETNMHAHAMIGIDYDHLLKTQTSSQLYYLLTLSVQIGCDPLI